MTDVILVDFSMKMDASPFTARIIVGDIYGRFMSS